jgi:recombination protein RecA
MPASLQQHLSPARHPPVNAPAEIHAVAEAINAQAEIQAVAEAVNNRLRTHAVRVGPKPTPGQEVVSSGFPALDATTQLGGFPRGRITELIGRATAGRETVAARTVAAGGGYSAWVDVPGLVDVSYLAHCGVDLDRLFILRPEQPADALAITAQALSSGHFSVVVLDALADLTPSGDTARAVGQFVRVVTPKLGRTPTVALVLSSPDNHYRSLAHAAALRISLVKAGLIRRGGVFRGWRTRAHILKSPGTQDGESGIEVWL